MLHLLRVTSQLGIEVFPVRSRRHGRAEDGLDQEAVKLLERRAVRVAERGRELLARKGNVLPESFGREVQATFFLETSPSDEMRSEVEMGLGGKKRGDWVPDEPEESFRRGVFLGLELVQHERLEVLRLGWGGQLAIADFLGEV